MARRMDESDELFRAVVRRKKMHPNPAYDPWKSYRGNVDEDGNLIPAQIPSETETYVNIYGPYTTKGPATAALNKNQSDGWGSPVVGGHVERAVVHWEVVE